jgi:protein SCO1/2
MIASVALVAAGCARGGKDAELPPFLLQLPKFQLVDQRGQPFGSASLRGKVWIANFIFTSCPTICPKLTGQMAKLQARLRDLSEPLHFVSFSVDPAHDTPQRLAAYARRYGADESRWVFLTGPLETVEKAVKEGFKIAIERSKIAGKGDDLFDITHGTRFVLVDRGGGIRGYFDSDEPGMEALSAAASALVRGTR